MSNTSRHVASVIAGESQFENELGSITQVTAKSLPILTGLSVKRITLKPGAMREPQWNVNANQIAYVVSGTVLVSMLGNVDAFSTFVVRPGQMYHVESGAIYHIENIGDDDVEIIAGLRTEDPQHFSLQDSFSAMTNNVLGNAYDLPGSAFAAFDRHQSSQIVARNGAASVPDTAGFPNAHLFDIETQAASLNPDYGSARFARKQFWAALDDISMYSLRINGVGMREPHWHPITGEMGYVHSGHGAHDRARPRRRPRHLRAGAGAGVLHPPRLPAPHRVARRRRHPLPDLLRPGDAGRHRVPSHRIRVLAGRCSRPHSACSEPALPVVPGDSVRSADRRADQSARPRRVGRPR